jgi:hypothetical protein
MLDKQKQVDKDSSKIFFLPFTSLVYKILYITLDIFENKNVLLENHFSK